MNDVDKYLKPNREDFNIDPFGYSALAKDKWDLARTMAGFELGFDTPDSRNDDLKNPILWLSQAHALSQAAAIILKSEPELEILPASVKSACDSQFCAVGLMLVGYSLEICLKAMIIIKNGVDGFKEIESTVRHHRLQELARFIPNLSKKDKAILRLLSEFVRWAGRYPDPGTGKEAEAESIFTVSERHKVSAKDLFVLSARIMGYSQKVADEA
jgi:hypothetical protein